MSGEWLEQVFERYSGQVLGYALKMTGDLERAREVTQESFLRLCDQDPEQVSGRVRQWLFTVCRNLVLDAVKKEKQQMLSSPAENLPDRNNLPASEALEALQSRTALLELVDALPQNQREVILLRFQSDLTYKEIGEITGLTVSNVGFLMHTGLKSLRQRYEKMDRAKDATGGAR